MPFKLGPLEIGLILVIIVVIFGVGKLPQVGSAIGKSIRAFKEGQTVEEEEETKSKKITKKKKKVVKKPAATEEKPVTPAS
jgi:sec-independent protein translocase protein TatA